MIVSDMYGNVYSLPTRIEPKYVSSSPLLAAELRRNANEPKLDIPAPKLHWSKALKEENERLKAALDYVLYMQRVVVQSRYDKYRNANDTEGLMAYRKCVGEVDLRLNAASQAAQEILDGEAHWDTETNSWLD